MNYDLFFFTNHSPTRPIFTKAPDHIYTIEVVELYSGITVHQKQNDFIMKNQCTVLSETNILYPASRYLQEFEKEISGLFMQFIQSYNLPL